MARIRSLRPELLTDERVAGLPDGQWRLLVGLLMLADDDGRLAGDPRLIRAAVLPLASPTAAVEVDAALAEFERLGFLSRYRVGGRRLLQISGWKDETSPWCQRIQRPTPSRLPKRDDDSVNPHGNLTEASRSDSGSLRDDSMRDRDLDRDRDRDRDREGEWGNPPGADAPSSSGRTGGSDGPPPEDAVPGIDGDAPPLDVSGVGDENGTPGAAETPPAGTGATSGGNGAPTKKRSRTAARTWTADDVRRVFGHWAVATGHPGARLTPDRKRRIEGRLRDGYTPTDLCEAIDGCTRSEWHRGENERGTVYDGLGLILRDGEHVDRFRSIAQKHDRPRPRQGPEGDVA